MQRKISFRSVRGTRDLFYEEIRRHRYVENKAFEVAQRYGFHEIATPIIEHLPVFQRTLGEDSDVVGKEMYVFEDRNGESLVLRPENTASIMRAYLSNHSPQINKRAGFFYRGPMFRYERPQKGRLRQFHQIGVEFLSPEASPMIDAETIAMGYRVLEELGVAGKTRLLINTLGDSESRATYPQFLKEYLGSYENSLSEDSRRRLRQNPLRVLDSKDPKDREIIAGAPVNTEYLNPQSKLFFDSVLEMLDVYGVEYIIDKTLVRGLDYYCHTTFEFVTDELGAKSAVLAGGRYDGLAEQLGGRPTAGVGWAAGVERLTMLLSENQILPERRSIMVIPVDEEQILEAVKLGERLRRAGYVVREALPGNVKKNMKRADQENARCVIIVGENEIARQMATCRDMDTGEQSEIPFRWLERELAKYHN